MSLENAKLDNLFTPAAFEWIKKLELHSLFKHFSTSTDTLPFVDTKPQKLSYISDVKSAKIFVDKLIKTKPNVVGIAFIGDEWSSAGADKKKHKKIEGQLSFSFCTDEKDTGYLFYGFGISYESDSVCETACMLKNDKISGAFIIELYKKIAASINNIAIINYKNSLHLTSPDKTLSLGISGAYNIFDLSIAAYLINPPYMYH